MRRPGVIGLGWLWQAPSLVARVTIMWLGLQRHVRKRAVIPAVNVQLLKVDTVEYVVESGGTPFGVSEIDLEECGRAGEPCASTELPHMVISW